MRRLKILIHDPDEKALPSNCTNLGPPNFVPERAGWTMTALFSVRRYPAVPTSIRSFTHVIRCIQFAVAFFSYPGSCPFSRPVQPNSEKTSYMRHRAGLSQAWWVCRLRHRRVASLGGSGIDNVNFRSQGIGSSRCRKPACRSSSLSSKQRA